MPLPSILVYNDLSGDEIKHVLQKRFEELLNQVPYLQRHLTLPRVRMSLEVQLETWADQANPETHRIADRVEVRGENSEEEEPAASTYLSTAVDSSPSPGGQPPDQIRDDYALAVPTPVRGPLGMQSGVPTVEEQRMTMPNGTIVDRTGKAPEYQRDKSTVIVQDYGPAGLAQGRFEREAVSYGNSQNRDGGAVQPPVIKKGK